MTDFVGKKCDLCGPDVSGDCQLRGPAEVRVTLASHWSILASHWSG